MISGTRSRDSWRRKVSADNPDVVLNANTMLADMKELALSVTTDADQKFELALALDDLSRALEIIESGGAKQSGNELKWQSLGDRALASWKIDLAARCFESAGDLSALLLIYTSVGNREGMKSLAEQARAKGLNNIAFSALLQLQDTAGCVDLLVSTERIPEAALFARTYAPSQVSRVVKAWKADLEGKKRAKIAAGIADPEEDGELFENWAAAMQAEQQGAVAQQPELVSIDSTADLVQQLHLGMSLAVCSGSIADVGLSRRFCFQAKWTCEWHLGDVVTTCIADERRLCQSRAAVFSGRGLASVDRRSRELDSQRVVECRTSDAS